MASIDRSRKLLELLEKVCELGGAERNRVLDEAYSSDPGLREEMVSLLGHQERSWSAMDDALGFPIDVAEAPKEVGPYRFIEELGRGGQAVVYLAEDTRLGRRVAVKLMSGLTWLAFPEARERFQREGVVAAKLDHPGICPVYDIGVHDGVSYISMRYVEGQTLAEKLSEHRRSAGVGEAGVPDENPSRPSTRADIDVAVALVEKAARAVHAAHEAGVLHRDIKPENIMVTPEGEPVLLDFGLAREEASEGETLTRSGKVMGTPAYMAPEQCSGETRTIDQRTDVFALGATLYELLTLRRPFEAPTLDALYREIREADPVPPRRRNARIPGDLEVVVLAALRKTPSSRYSSALAFAEDLRAVRELRPITARRAGALDQLKKLARRNKGAVASIALVMTALIAGVILMGIGLLRAQDAENLADERRRDAEGALSQADAVSEFLAGLLSDANRVNRGGKEPTFREALDAAAARLERDFGDQPLVKATLHRILGLDYEILGAVDSAISHIRDCLRIRLELLGKGSPETLEAQVLLGRVLERNNQVKESHDVLVEAAGWSQAIDRATPKMRGQLHHHLAQAKMVLGKFGDAEAHALEALRIFQSVDDQAYLAQTKAGMAAILRRLGRLREGERYARESLATLKKEFGPESSQVATLLNNLAVNLRSQNRLVEAEKHTRRSIEIKEKLFGKGHRELLALSCNWGGQLTHLHRYEEAEPVLRECVRAHRKAFGERHRVVAFPLNFLAQLLNRVDRNDESEEAFREVHEILVAELGPGDRRAEEALFGLAKALMGQGKLAEAEKCIRRVVPALVKRHGEEHRVVANVRLWLAQCLRRQGRADAVDELVSEVEAHYAADPILGARCLRERALLLLGTDAAQATSLLRRAVKQRSTAKPRGELEVDLARALMAQERWKDAESLLKKAHADFTASLSAIHWRTLRAARTLADLYEKTGRSEEAATWRAHGTPRRPKRGG